MIENILYFVAGLLIASTVAIMLGPVIWQRAVSATRRRIHGNIPITATEIQADKDRVRAEYAIMQARLEKRLEQLQSDRMLERVESEKASEQAEALRKQLHAKSVNIQDLEQALAAIRLELSATMSQLSERNRETRKIDEEYRQLQIADNEKRDDIVSKEIKINSLENKLSITETELSRLEDDFEAMKKQSNQISSKLMDTEKDFEDTSRQLANAKKDLEDMQTKMRQQDVELGEARAVAQENEALAQQLKQHLDVVSQDLLRQQDKFDSTVREIEKATEERYATLQGSSMVDADESDKTSILLKQAVIDANKERDEALARADEVEKRVEELRERFKDAAQQEIRDLAYVRNNMHRIATEVLRLSDTEHDENWYERDEYEEKQVAVGGGGFGVLGKLASKSSGKKSRNSGRNRKRD